MKMIRNKDMELFFQRCIHNIQTDQKNQFLNTYVTKENEQQIIQELRDNGFSEWNDPKNQSIFLSADEWENSSYHASIQLENIHDEHFSYEKDIVYGNELFNIDVIQKDPNRELNDYMKLRAMDRDFETIYLLQDDQDWMLDVPSEAITNDPYAKKAHGNVVTFGLGIGYFAFMASNNENITSITIVEKSKQVIDMFKKYILPQFPSCKPIYLICEDAFHCWNETFLSKFDYIYVDIWQSNNDGLVCITKLLEQYQTDFNQTDFWIEDSCYEIMWTLSMFYFKEIYDQKKANLSPQTDQLMKKIRTYYSHRNILVESVEDIKFLMYDTETIRNILATKI